MQEPGRAEKRLNIPFFEGVNSLTSFNIGKKTEFVHAENARSKVIGTIEKREGQTVLGTNTSDQPFVTTANYALFPFQNDNNPGLYRISVTENATLAINVVDNIHVSDTVSAGGAAIVTYSIVVADDLTISEKVNENPGGVSTIYYINSSNQWIPLTGAGADVPSGVFDFTYAEGNVFLVNLNSANRYIGSDGTTVTTSTTGAGHLFNTPPASRVNFYKNRLYLGDFVRDFVRYKTTILRSSYPMGIIALINDDYASHASGGTAIEITDTKYFYTDSGASVYDVYRGQTLISTITVTTINETSIVVTHSGTPSFLASDEIWISGTYAGSKVFRWVNNPSITGRDVQQYDTFKLSGGENDDIKMLKNIGNVMLISNRSTMASWNDYTLENFDLDIGCVSKKGYVKMLGTLFFIHYTGVYATSGGVPKLISNKIEKYITGATRVGKEASAAGKKGRSIFFTLGDVTLYQADGSINKVLSDVCIEYNLTQENWFVHTNVKASEFATFLETLDSDRLEFTDTAGNHSAKEFLSGNTDDGNEIPFRVDTIRLTPQADFENSSNPIALLMEVERGAGMQAFVSLNNSEEYYAVEGEVIKGLSVVKITNKDGQRGKPPSCRLISISVRDNSKQLCKMSRMTLIYLPTTEEIPDNE